jgi:hypothetical protein
MHQLVDQHQDILARALALAAGYGVQDSSLAYTQSNLSQQTNISIEQQQHRFFFPSNNGLISQQ